MAEPEGMDVVQNGIQLAGLALCVEVCRGEVAVLETFLRVHGHSTHCLSSMNHVGEIQRKKGVLRETPVRGPHEAVRPRQQRPGAISPDVDAFQTLHVACDVAAVSSIREKRRESAGQQTRRVLGHAVFLQQRHMHRAFWSGSWPALIMRGAWTR